MVQWLQRIDLIFHLLNLVAKNVWSIDFLCFSYILEKMKEEGDG